MTSKYFTNFGFKGYALTEFHCTHLYLGEVQPTTLAEIMNVLENFFRTREVSSFEVSFDQLEILNGRLVLASNLREFPKQYTELFTKLTRIQPSEHNFYPHVTLKVDDSKTTFHGIINRYVLVEKKEKQITPIYVENL